MSTRNACDYCTLKDRTLCGAVSEPAADALERIAQFRRIPAGQVVHSDHNDLSWFAIILSGVVKLVRSQRDGRQQIVGLLFPSDFIGRPFASNSSLIAEATTNLELCCFSRTAFENLLREHQTLEQELLRRALDELDTSREWMFLLGRKTAEEKVASLLLFIAERTARGRKAMGSDVGPIEFELPLSRVEMADCLGLTIETVSREIRQLKTEGVIITEGRRRVTVPDRALLRRLSESEQE